MEYRRLGPTGLKVSVIAFGNWLNSNSEGALANTIECVRRAWEGGVNTFDTAQVYGEGEAERQMGAALRALGVPRHHYVLSTKIFKLKDSAPNRCGLSRKHIIEGLNASLKRLQVDYVDLVFCHRPDFQIPMQETCRAMDWVVRKGWAHYWGTSEWNQYQIAQAHMLCSRLGLTPPVIEQPQYNLFNREKMEMSYKNMFKRGILGTTVWSPLLSGVLTGKYNEGIPADSRFATNDYIKPIYLKYFSQESKPVTLKKLHDFQALAKELNCTMAELAVAWCIRNPDVSCAIAGASKPQQLQSYLNAVQIKQKITPQIEGRIDTIFQTCPQGKRSMLTFAPEVSRRREIISVP